MSKRQSDDAKQKVVKWTIDFYADLKEPPPILTFLRQSNREQHALQQSLQEDLRRFGFTAWSHLKKIVPNLQCRVCTKQIVFTEGICEIVWTPKQNEDRMELQCFAHFPDGKREIYVDPDFYGVPFPRQWQGFELLYIRMTVFYIPFLLMQMTRASSLCPPPHRDFRNNVPAKEATKLAEAQSKKIFDTFSSQNGEILVELSSGIQLFASPYRRNMHSISMRCPNVQKMPPELAVISFPTPWNLRNAPHTFHRIVLQVACVLEHLIQSNLIFLK